MKNKTLHHSRYWTVQLLVLLALLLGFTITETQAQQAASYIYTNSSGQSLDGMSNSSQIIDNGQDNSQSGSLNIGFNFTFEGSVYTTYSLTPDGFVKLGSATSSQSTNQMTSSTNIPKLCAWWDDLATGGSSGSGEVRTVLRGSAPNRIRVIHFFVTVPKATGQFANANATFQVWLYETTNVIEFRYGSGNTGTSATVGIRGAVATPASYISISSSSHGSSTSSANDANTAWPGNGRMYKFTPPPPACSGTPNPGATVTSFSTVCGGQSFSLSLQNTIPGTGLTYAWQTSSSSSGPWSSFGAANAAAITTSLTATAWYRCVVTCAGVPGNSTPVQVTAGNCCEYTFRLRDNDNDGWEGALMQVRLGTTVIATVGSTFTSGSSQDINIDLLDNASYNLFYLNDGSDASEVGIRIYNNSNVQIYSLGSGNGTQGNTLFTWSADCPTPCSGPPVPGNTISSQSIVCSTDLFTLSLQNTFSVAGITFQWQSSPNNSTWTNIASATNATLNNHTQSAATWYRCLVSCYAGTPVASTSVQVTQTLCYCESEATDADDDEIFNVTLGTLNNTSGCGATAPGYGSVNAQYSNYISLPAPNISQGSTNTISLKLGYCDGNSYNASAAVFIDFNQNAVFDASELVYNSPYQSFAVNGTVVTGSVVVPQCATTGLTRMRVVMTEGDNSPSACGTYTWGETEDYLVNIVASAVVAPVASTISGPLTGTCNSSLTYTAAVGFVGSIHWQSATALAGPYTDLAGATSASQILNSPNPGTYYLRVRFTGQGCVSDAISNVLTIVISTPTVAITRSTPSNNICRGTQVTLTASGAGPYLWNTGATTQSIVVSPVFTTSYSVNAGAAPCSGSGSITLTVIGGPFAAASSTPATAQCPGTVRNLSANLVNGVTPTYTHTGGSIDIPVNAPFQILGFYLIIPNPYPSNLAVSGLPAGATISNVKINGFSHAFPEDMDIALVAPNGSKVLLLADNGAGNVINGINLTFKDGSPNLPSALTTGTFRTTTNTSWNGTQVSGPFGSTLSSFSGAMNGTWKLYVWDDETGDAGEITSWSITFNGALQPFNYNGPVTYTWTGSNGFTSNAVNPTDNPTTPTTYTLTVADNTCSSSTQVTANVLPEPSVTTFTGSPFCENSTIDFYTDGNAVTATSSNGALTVKISGSAFMDEISWTIRNNANAVIASGGNYAHSSSNTITVNPSATDYPVRFFIETQGAFGDNDADYAIICSLGADTLVSGTILGSDTFLTTPQYCGSPSGNVIYNWSGPNSFSSTDEDPSISSAQFADGGEYTVTIIDGNGCMNSYTTSVIVNDNPEPYIATNNPASCNGSSDGMIQVGVNGGTPFYSFYESNLGQTFTGMFFGVPAGTYYFDITDINQCMSSSALEVTVETVPNVAPVINCPASFSVTNDLGVCGAVVNYTSPVGTDVCPILGTVQTTGLPSGSVFPIGTTTNTFEVTDELGLATSCSFTVTVIDNLAPVFGPSASNMTVECDGAGNVADLNGWVSSFGGASATDECGAVSWSNNFNGLSDLCGATGSATVTFTATDVNNNASSTIATFTIVDTTVPSITAAADQTVECDGNGNAVALAAWIASNGGATASDACSGVTWSNNFGSLSDLCGATGSATVIFTATDACGNASSSTATFTIVDTTVPSITAASNQTVECDGAGNAIALAAWIASNGGATASDACSGVNWSNNFGSLSDLCGATGSATVTFTATDACGNASSSTATFTIVDTTVPSITAASNQTVECDGNGNAVALAAWIASNGGATASDACSGVTWGNNYSGLSDLCGATGSATVTFTATDACGNASSSTATFTIVDTTVPSITAASNQTVECDGNGNAGALAAWIASNGGATASDACSGVTWGNNYSGLSDLCGATGSATVTFTATDACGNASSSTATFTIVDTTVPSITAAADQTVECDGNGNAGALAGWIASNGGATASDACSGVTWSNNFGSLSDLCGATGSATVTFTATDACGNASSSTATFTIVDTTVPSITAASNQTVECDGNGNAGALAAWIASNGGATASDACSGVTWGNNYSGLSDLCGATGSATVTFTATDACGNASSSTATFTIEDTTAPTVFCPANIVVNNDLNQCGALVSYLATASDVCSGSASIAYDIAPGSFFAIGTTTVNVSATDACGNISNCSFTVIVNDVQIPGITCAGNINTLNDAGMCGAIETFSISYYDNCSGSTLVQTAGLPSGSVFPVGVTVNTFVVTDASGNSNTCSFSVSVTDSEVPTITNCPANFSSCNPVSWIPPTITDNCPGVQITSSHVPGTNFPIGTTAVTYTATDAYNNVSTCTFNVTRLEQSVAATSITSNRDYSNICLGESITLTINGGSLGQSANWKWYRGTCGGIALPAFTGMTSITVNPTTTTTYFARAEGLCNTTTCASITVVVSITGPPNGILTITSMPAYGAPGVTGTITCTPVPGATFYRWTSNLGHINSIWFPSTPGPVETAVPSVNVLFNLSQSNYQIRVIAGNACGRTNNESAHIRGTVPSSTCMTGPVLACPNTTATYSVASCPIPGTNNYQWSVSGNATIISGQGSQTITVSFGAGFTSSQVCVNGITNFGLAGPQTCLTVSNSTAAPGDISGNNLPCQSGLETYTIAPVQNATSYIWSTNIVGATTSGSTTSGTIQFPAGPFNGQVCVRAVTSCGTSVPSCFSVSSGLPGNPGPILGPESGICGAIGNYALTTSDANSYNWILPAGVTLVSPNGSNSVQVQFPSAPGAHTITVVAFYDCGSASSSITVNGAPGSPIVTPATICAGGTDETYIASAAGADSYTWSTSGADYEQCSNPSCSNYYIIWEVAGGSFSVQAQNLCGVSAVPFNLSTNCRISNGGQMETKVYPNPTSGELNIEFSSYAGGNYNLTITDMAGRTVLVDNIKASSGMNKHNVDLSQALPGMYMLYLKDGSGEISVTKITVE